MWASGNSAALRALSRFARSLNRVYLVRATPSPKFLAPLGTSEGALRVSYRVVYFPSTWFFPYGTLENTAAHAF